MRGAPEPDLDVYPVSILFHDGSWRFMAQSSSRAGRQAAYHPLEAGGPEVNPVYWEGQDFSESPSPCK